MYSYLFSLGDQHVCNPIMYLKINNLCNGFSCRSPKTRKTACCIHLQVKITLFACDLLRIVHNILSVQI